SGNRTSPRPTSAPSHPNQSPPAIAPKAPPRPVQSATPPSFELSSVLLQASAGEAIDRPQPSDPRCSKEAIAVQPSWCNLRGEGIVYLEPGNRGEVCGVSGDKRALMY